MSTPDYRCCDTLNGLTAEPRIAGHHALCPRFGMAAIEARGAAAAELVALAARTANEIDPAYCLRGLQIDNFIATLGQELDQARADRAVLLTALRERDAEVKRLRPLVEEVAHLDEIDPAGADRPILLHRLTTAATRARAALRPAGTLASIPPDSCDGDDR